MKHEVIHGDCIEVMRGMESGSVDAVVTDPPYPCIKRSYGYWTEAEWFEMMDVVVPECRRILKPTGSAVFILQPNSERVGRMRTWLWEFMLKWGKEWGIVQDVWWWNNRAMVEAHAIQGRLMRPSVKPCVWLGHPTCWRDQDGILWDESEETKARKASERANGGHKNVRRNNPSGHGSNRFRIMNAADNRGGVTPYNLIFADHGRSQDTAGGAGHSAGTPFSLARWWTRYICPPDGTVLDPFLGSGTMALAANAEGRNFIGIEKEAEYVEIARRRIAAAQAELPLFAQEPSCS